MLLVYFRRAARHGSTGIFGLDPRQFEEVNAEIWRRFGYDVELTKRTRDGGCDVSIRADAPSALLRVYNMSNVRGDYGHCLSG